MSEHTDRLAIAPVPSGWRWNHNWQPKPILTGNKFLSGFDDVTESIMEESTTPLVPTTKVGFSSHRNDELDAWAETHRTNGIVPGRVREIAARVALISASANGDAEVSVECLKAALVFGDWQLAVRGLYSPGEGRNPTAVVAGVVLDAFEAAHKSEDDGAPLACGDRQVVKGGWVHLAYLAKRNNWHIKYGTAIKQVIDALVASQTLEEHVIEEKGARPRRTGKYRLITLDLKPLPKIAAKPKEAA